MKVKLSRKASRVKVLPIELSPLIPGETIRWMIGGHPLRNCRIECSSLLKAIWHWSQWNRKASYFSSFLLFSCSIDRCTRTRIRIRIRHEYLENTIQFWVKEQIDSLNSMIIEFYGTTKFWDLGCDQLVRDELVQYTGFFCWDIELCLILSRFLQLIYRLIVHRRIEGLKDRRIDEATTLRFWTYSVFCA